MALNIKNAEVERLAAEVAGLASETKTEAIRKALVERRDRLGLAKGAGNRKADLMAWLAQEVWPLIPEMELGRRLTSEEESEILGYGPEGV